MGVYFKTRKRKNLCTEIQGKISEIYKSDFRI